MYENIILIPFRERDEHLEYFITNTVPILKQYLPNSKVVVVEQNKGKLFNRGALLNVGFKEYHNKTKFFFTHDVDLNPTQKCVEEHYKKNVNDTDVLGIFTDESTLGGIIKITDSIIHKINGFPNDVWGWGNEDKALQNRAEFYNIKKITNITIQNLAVKNIGQGYIKQLHKNDADRTNQAKNHIKHYHDFHHTNREKKEEMIMSSGLNNLVYTILERKMMHDMVELIKVDI